MLMTCNGIGSGGYGTVYLPLFSTVVMVAFAVNGCETPKLSCAMRLTQTTTVPDGGCAINPAIPERSGKATVVEPWR